MASSQLNVQATAASAAILTLVGRIGAPFGVMVRTGRRRLTPARAPAGSAAGKVSAAGGWFGRAWRARRTAPPAGGGPAGGGGGGGGRARGGPGPPPRRSR